MKGTFIVTGANGGLGAKLVALFLQSPYAKEYKGLFTVRDLASADTLKETLANSPNANDHEVRALDLGTLASVRTAAKDLNQQVASRTIPPIRAIVLNAALQHTKGIRKTDDGLEANFAVNYLSNFLLTNLILQSMDPSMGRIVIVSSWTHDPFYYMNHSYITDEKHKTIIQEGGLQALAKPLDNDAEGDEYNASMRRYGMSKTMMVMFMYATDKSDLAIADLVLGTSFSVVLQPQISSISQSLPSIRVQWVVPA